MEVKDSKAQGRCREARSEGSVEQECEPMNKNRIRGVSVGRASARFAKSISIKDAKRRFGGCALKVVELTSGGLSLVAENPSGWKPTKCGAISTEATTAVSRRHSR
jgi:hypothetical protein